MPGDVIAARDWSATTVFQYQSGLPWTPFYRFEKRQDPLLENSRRFPASHVVNFRGEKFFKIYGQDLRLLPEAGGGSFATMSQSAADISTRG